MIFSGFANVAMDDSYLIGWNQNGDELILDLEVLLSDRHSAWTPFNPDTEHGSYRRGQLVFSGVRSQRGLPSASHVRQWDTKLGEFRDVTEINGYKTSDDTFELDTDMGPVVVQAARADLRIDM